MRKSTRTIDSIHRQDSLPFLHNMREIGFGRPGEAVKLPTALAWRYDYATQCYISCRVIGAFSEWQR
jgi:hypothetical protein